MTKQTPILPPVSDTGRVLTVAICTHNRARALERLIDRLAPRLAAAAVELIVVDSASDGANALAVRTAAERQPNVRLIRLDSPGVSLARNAALAATRSPWLAFIDDDEWPAFNWTEEVLALIQRLPDDCAGCGGNVFPIWPQDVNLPKIGGRWRGYLSLIDQTGEFDQSENLHFGIGHSVVRVAALRDIGDFDVRLGRDGASLLSGEEVLLLNRLIQSGWRVWHSDRLSVGHLIPAERLDPHWSVDRAYWEGVSQARLLEISRASKYHWRALQIKAKLLVLYLLNMVVEIQEADLRIAFCRGFTRNRGRRRLVRTPSSVS